MFRDPYRGDRIDARDAADADCGDADTLGFARTGALLPPTPWALDHYAWRRTAEAGRPAPATGRIRAGTAIFRAELFPVAKIPHDVRGRADTLSRILRLQICVLRIPS